MTLRPMPHLRSQAEIQSRRSTFFTLVLLIVCTATWFMADVLWRGGLTFVETGMLLLYLPLIALAAFGFTCGVFGAYHLSRGGDPRRISSTLDWEHEQIPLASTAVVIPIYNENVSRVYEGLRVVFRSIEETGQLAHFDFFILSDSADTNKWVEEEVAWVELCKQLDAFGKVFYRKRRQAINKKSGNIADFLRRWGRKYRYMIVLDADSVMSGASLVSLVKLMEKNPTTGIIQTAPKLVNAESLFGRILQFSTSLYDPTFLCGLNYWQQNDGNYWGHNAILRIAPFIEHCALPDLPGTGPIGGRILSHDFIEAALMRRAGYEVWLADLDGSYEESPPTLIDYAKRDRRWCQGNLQHTWLLTAKGFRNTSRLHLLLGIMGYAASPLWLLFLLLGSWRALHEADPGQLSFHKDVGLTLFADKLGMAMPLLLFGLALTLLFTPKCLALALALGDKATTQRYGGPTKLVTSFVLENLLSILVAPILMLFHSKFVLYALLGRGVSWVEQNRGELDGTDWREAILTHTSHTLLGLAWAWVSWHIHPVFLLWMSPVLAGLMLAVPLSISLSKKSFGSAAARKGIFLIPEEHTPPRELARLQRNLATVSSRHPPDSRFRNDYGLMQATLDPYINAVHLSLLRQRKNAPEESREHFGKLRQRLLKEGPQALSAKEKIALLRDAESMSWLHRQLWLLPNSSLAPWWVDAMRQYNILTAQPASALYR